MKKKNLFLGVLLASAIFSLASCTKEKKPTETDKPTETGETPKTTTGETPKPTETGVKPTETSVAPVEKFTVTFNSNGGSDVAAIADIEAGSKISAPTAPTKESTEEFDYEFLGWYTDEDCTNEFDFETAINSSFTLYAGWKETERDKVIIDKSKVQVFYQIDDDIDFTGLVVSLKTEVSTVEVDSDNLKITTNFNSSKLGEYTVTVSLKSDPSLFTTYKVFVCEEDYSEYQAISTAAELLEFRSLLTSSGKYLLTNDIDMEGISLPATSVSFNGEFNGNGYTIKNAVYKENASNKTGLLTKYLNDGAVVKNVKFRDCIAELQGETMGMVTGEVFDNVLVTQTEFNNCYVRANNYAGLVAGRSESKTLNLTMSEITCKNGTMSEVVSYGGTLIGDIAAGESATNRATINIFDCDIDMELKGSNGNGGFLSGRIRSNTNINIKDVLIRNAVLPSQTGLVCGGGSNNAKDSTVTVENLYIMSTNAVLLQSCAVKNATNPVTTFEISYTNSYIASSVTSVTDNTTSFLATPLTSVDKATTDINWLDETLDLGFGEDGEWTAEENDPNKYRLVAGSTNVRTPGTSIEKIKLVLANTKVRFEKGTDFANTGLAVTAVYSDGVNLPLAYNAEVEGYTIDISKYDKTKPGKYTVTVKSTENPALSIDYEVEVVEQTGIEAYTEFAKLTYVTGEKLDLKNLIVYSVWTDDMRIKLVNSKDKVLYTTNESELDMNTAGEKELIITQEGFAPVTVIISVVGTQPTVVDNYVYVNVDADAKIDYQGARVDGIETFTTLADAVSYLDSASLEATVNKVIYVANGIYHEKVTIPSTLKNLKIVGEDRDLTVIEYDAVEDTVDPISGNKYVMDCATLNVNAEGFGLENITIDNSFDYINDNTKYGNPQGFALTINGDGAVLDNVRLYGNQDTLFFRNGRTYIKDSIIMGNIDFIFGENTGIAFFDQCTIIAVGKSLEPVKNNGYVTAMKGDKDKYPTYGYVFSKCEFTDDGNVLDGAMSLGRPWGPGASVAYIECNFSAAYSKLAYDGSAKSRWFDMSGNKPGDAHFVEYGSTGDGAITEAVAGGSVLTKDQADAYTAENTFAASNGGVTWASGAFDYQTAYAVLVAAKTKASVATIEVVNTEIQIYEQGTCDLNAYVTPWNAEIKEITAEIDNPEAISYADGVITGLKAGTTAKLTLKCGSLTKEINVTVVEGTFHQVVFVTEGSAVETQTVLEGETIEDVTTTLAGTRFAGWYTDEDYTTAFDVTEPVMGALTLYAKFDKLLTYSYDNAGDGVLDSSSTNTAQYHTEVGGDANVKEGMDYVSVPIINASGYLQFDIVGYTKKVKVELVGSTSGTSSAVNSQVSAYAADGTKLDTQTFVLCTGKITTANTIEVSAESNIAYIRIENTYTKAIAIIKADVTYERNVTASKSYSITFGADGNYADFLDPSVTVTDHASEPTSQVNGTIELNVKAGGTVVVTGYPTYYAYSIQVGDAEAVAATQECTWVTVTEDTVVKVASTNYLYTIEVIYPINKDAEFSYAANTLNTNNGLAFSYVIKKTVNDNGDSYQFKGDRYNAAVLSVADDCTVTIIGHSAGYGLMDIYVNGVLQEIEISSSGTYVINAKANDVIVATAKIGSLSNSYIKGITVDYE